MKIISGGRSSKYLARFGIFLIITALIAGIVGCGGGGGNNLPPSENLEIRTWYDLDAVRDNLAGTHTLLNNLNSTTPGYEELASPTANNGTGWETIGSFNETFSGTFRGTLDSQGYEIHDLFINRPEEESVGLFSWVISGVIKDIGMVNVTVTGNRKVGSLVADNHGTVSNSYSTGTVTGNSGVGGLVGVNGDGTVSNSHSTASVTSDNNVGGLVGENGGTVSNSYSSGNVTSDNLAGGLVGWNSHSGPVSNSFWDTETSGQSSSDGGTGKTTAKMQDITTFSSAGWDIVGVVTPSIRNTSYIWNIVDDETYPFLSWEPVS